MLLGLHLVGHGNGTEVLKQRRDKTRSMFWKGHSGTNGGRGSPSEAAKHELGPGAATGLISWPRGSAATWPGPGPGASRAGGALRPPGGPLPRGWDPARSPAQPCWPPPPAPAPGGPASGMPGPVVPLPLVSRGRAAGREEVLCWEPRSRGGRGPGLGGQGILTWVRAT